MAVMVVACVLSGCVAQPAESPHHDALLAVLEAKLTESSDVGALAVIDGDDVEVVRVRSDENTMFEIGSISKALTGELLARAVERGEVSLDDALGEYLPLGDSPAASVTLLELATHHSGLPTERTRADGVTPFAETVDELVAEAVQSPVDEGHPFVYNNFGAALLGHAVARAAGSDFASLLTERVLEPAGMTDAVVPDQRSDVPEALAQGTSVVGDPVEPGFGLAWAPAWGVDASLDDLVSLAKAVLDGPLSSSSALEPTGVVGGGYPRTQLGLLWEINLINERTLTGKGGLTLGFASVIEIDREAGTAVVVVSNRVQDLSSTLEPAFAVMGG